MSELWIGVLCLAASLVLIQTGMHIGVALMLLSFVGVWALKGVVVAGKLLASSVATSIASDAYAVIPLFVLMGLFVSSTNMGRDTFDRIAHSTARHRGLRGQGQSGGSEHLGLAHFRGHHAADLDHGSRAGDLRAVSMAGAGVGRPKLEPVVRSIILPPRSHVPTG
jgi:hypothetical protein